MEIRLSIDDPAAYLEQLIESVRNPVVVSTSDLQQGKLTALHAATVALDTKRDPDTDLLDSIGPLVGELASDLQRLLAYVCATGMLIRELAADLAEAEYTTTADVLSNYARQIHARDNTD